MGFCSGGCMAFAPVNVLSNESELKARGLAQQAGPTGWLEESDPAAGCDFVRDERFMPPALTDQYT